MIYHIYWGTSGNSGLYLHEIYQTLKAHGFKQRAFVNYYYPFDYGDKLFFKRGDIAYGVTQGKLRKVVQLFEVLKAYMVILCCSIKDRPQLINYSHVGQSYFFILIYLRILKAISGAKLIVTCHDVAPHSGGTSEIKFRRKIFHVADYLLVHTNDSARELVEMFGIDKRRIVNHLFPIMDLSILSGSECNNPFNQTDFLFIGHLRKDKGIELLLDAWYDFHKICPEAKLRVCGRKQFNVSFNQRELEKCNVEFNLHFISDEDYFNHVSSARYVVLPYIWGTNSGIISTVLSLGTNVITSDIPMFSENLLVGKDDKFKAGNKEALINILQMKYLKRDNTTMNKLSLYKSEFNKSVIAVYKELQTKHTNF
ncbi:glycosyltransferase [Bacteroides heparinolyticus]|uniref:glycosyltransferase n=1 Tax=Prevotella heparinolytica TaxID=28113 RepID=UPI0023F54FFD|nr:glycosyltransferase [Bacteroides heparinolyticus]